MRVAADAANAACVRKNCSSGDEGGGGGAAQQCKGVAGFGSGEVGEGGLSSLQRPPPSIPTTTRRHLEL